MAYVTTQYERIKQELKQAGMSGLALRRFSSRYLPSVIHEDEHIKAAVAGRRKESEGLFGYAEGMLIATDQRVIYLDHRPGFTTMDEITYDVVAGVNLTVAGPSASLTLFTRVTNYVVSHANVTCATVFAEYIEKRRVDTKLPAEVAQRHPLP